MTKNPQLAELIAREHETLRRAREDIQNELDRLWSEPGLDREIGTLRGMLRMFAHHLKRHFELEEAGGGLLDLSAEPNPGSQRLVECLCKEHRELEKSSACSSRAPGQPKRAPPA